MAKTKKTELRLIDFPTVNGTEAGSIYGWCRKTFKQRFRLVLHEYIAYADTRAGRRYLLTDVYKYAYPEADNHTIHFLADQFLLRRMQKKQNSVLARKLLKLKDAG